MMAELFHNHSGGWLEPKGLDKISDYHRHGFNLCVVCQGCVHAAVVDSLALRIARSKARKSRDMGAIERDLRCRVCGSRRVKWGPVDFLPGERG
jgi:predicted molibdopterin-dependent oxidoreductase YjgC